PSYGRDVAPILERHCVGCHRPDEIGPMPLGSYTEVRPWAKAIREAVVKTKMPPWFADPHSVAFSNNPSLTDAEIATISAWVGAGAPEGSAGGGARTHVVHEGWNIGRPDAVWEMPKAFEVPASGELDYQYIIVPTGLKQDRWVQQVEIRPGNRAVVHHAVVYVREPGSAWLRGQALGEPFTMQGVTRNDILFTYTPGNSHDEWPPGMAKLIPAGSDLVFQMHYTPAKKVAHDQTRIGVRFAKEKPAKRVLTLQLNQDRLYIPPNTPDYRASVSGTMPAAATLLSLYPHMHLRGKQFEYTLNGKLLLRVNDYDFYWQLTYRLAAPLQLHAHDRLECTAVFDNSRNNPRNPDPDDFVRYGQQSSDEMMIGFFDVAVDASLDKFEYFEQRRKQSMR
ncbi:MAG: cytochrome c, partial [Acidobacteriaceae bacterium]|nr:cytochrome c [Acidobacteriaceae bacterium]